MQFKQVIGSFKGWLFNAKKFNFKLQISKFTFNDLYLVKTKDSLFIYFYMIDLILLLIRRIFFFFLNTIYVDSYRFQ